MKTICFYAVASHLGGGERSLLELVSRIQERPGRGYRPWVILPKEGPFSEALKDRGVAVSVLPMPESFFRMSRGEPLLALRQALLSTPGFAVYFLRLLALLRRERPVLLHTNAIKCHGVGTLAGAALGIPVLWHLRDILAPGPVLRALRALRKSARVRVVANSLATARAFSASGGVSVVYNGLDPQVFQPAKNDAFRKRLGITDHTPIVGIVGVLARWKGQLKFLEMAAQLLKEGVRAKFVIVGGEIYDTVSDRGYGEELRVAARRLGLEGQVLFAGHQDDPALAMNGLDVAVHASLKPEPFGRVAVEALACGVPLVAAADGGILEIVEEGKSGLLYPPGDAPAMARAVSRLLSEPALRARLIEGGRKRFAEKFSSESYVDGVLALYDSITRR